MSAGGSAAWALPPLVEFQPAEPFRSLAPFTEYLVDPQGTLSFDQATSPESASQWRLNNSNTLSFGFTSYTYWLRFVVKNTGASTTRVLTTGYPWMLEGDLYVMDGSRLVDHQKWGLVPIHERTVSFHFDIPAGKKYQVVLRAKPNASMLMDMKLMSPSAAYTQEIWEARIHGGYAWLVLAMVLYNLFLAYNLRDRKYLFYVFYILVFAAFTLEVSGLFNTHPSQIYIHTRVILLLGIFSHVFLVWFARVFFETAVRNPRLDRVLKTWKLVLLALVIPALMMPVSIIFHIWDAGFLISQLMILSVAGWYWKNRYRPARIFFTAQLPQLVGVAIVGLTYYRLFPVNTFTLHASIFGSTLEFILFSMALSDRYNILRQEKEQALHQALENESLAVKRLRENTELIQANEAAEKARQLAEDATALKDKFVTLVAHDVRSPFSTIMVMAQALEEDQEHPLHESQLELVKSIREGGSNFIGMVDELLNLNRLQTGKIVPQSESFHPFEMAQDAMLLKFLAIRKGVTLLNTIPPRMTIHADRQLIGEVLQNLITNSIKFCRQGDTITITAPKTKIPTLMVQDTGVGVEPVFIDNLFSPTEKTTSRGTGGERGTGLGLPLCKEIMAAHGGTIRVESTVGKGTTFFLEFPKT
ncbi:MAG: sensor histidine kinase [Deltaproteobacteria bacterium]|nr:sensor histidine kinase [Deltaproteobacteria bacterium]